MARYYSMKFRRADGRVQEIAVTSDTPFFVVAGMFRSFACDKAADQYKSDRFDIKTDIVELIEHQFAGR